MSESIQTIIAEAVKYKQEAKSLWEELDACEGDKTFYQKFGNMTSSAGVMESIKTRMAGVEVHFTQKPDTSSSSRTEKQQVGLLAKVVGSLQALVRDHGVALEYIRELLIQQDATLTKVQEKLDEPGPRDTPWMEQAIQEKVAAATSLATLILICIFT